MKITLYYNKSEIDSINKELKYMGDLYGTLRNPVSFLNPNIDIEMNNVIVDTEHDVSYFGFIDISYTENDIEYDVSITSQIDILKCNYIFIEEFNRYYFVDNIIIQNNKIYTFILSVDALESHKDNILSLNAFVTRNEFNYNEYIKDDLISYYYDKDVIEYIAEKGDRVNTTFKTDYDIAISNILVSVINDKTSVDWYSSTPPDNSLPYVKPSLTGTGSSYRTYATWTTELETLCDFVMENDTLNDYILSVMLYPFTLQTSGDIEVLRLGSNDMIKVDIQGRREVLVESLSKEIPYYHVVADFVINANSFMDYEPYTKYELYLPYASWITLSADDILNNRIIVYYVVDYASGTSSVNVYDITNSKILYTGSCQLGVKLGLTTSTQKEVNDTRASNNIGLGVGLLTSVMSIVGGVASMNPLLIGGGAIAMGSQVAHYVQNENTNYVRANGQISSGLTGLYLPQDVKIRKTKLKPKNYNNEWAHLYGKPLNEYIKLSQLKGYTRVGEIHLENINATKEEIQNIETLLKNGVIIK